mmetsp:Transcript_18535/g.42389  ORF Transcript_18535/g.42389 Transcript_18535/m.42389 type:complete len:340 (-) Transcript_18535:657-1676(-)
MDPSDSMFKLEKKNYRSISIVDTHNCPQNISFQDKIGRSDYHRISKNVFSPVPALEMKLHKNLTRKSKKSPPALVKPSLPALEFKLPPESSPRCSLSSNVKNEPLDTPKSVDVPFSYNPMALHAPKLDKLMDIPCKKAVVVVAMSFYAMDKDECSKLSHIASTIVSILDRFWCDFDVSEDNFKFKGVCRLNENIETFTSFSIKIFHAFLKGSSQNDRRHVIVARRLSGDSLSFFGIFQEIRSALSMKSHISPPKLSSHNHLCDGFDMCNNFFAEESLQGTIIDLSGVLAKDSIDQKIFAVKTLYHLIKLEDKAKKLVIENLALMDSFKDIFDFTDDLFR